jgi:hypothetical protein
MNKPINLNTVNRLKTKHYHFVNTKRLKEITQRENDMLLAYNTYQQQIEQLNVVSNAVREELANNNKYHPMLSSTEHYTLPSNQSYYDVLQLRIGAPVIGWDDTKRVGSVKILFRNSGKTDQVGYMYAFTDAVVHSAKDFDKLLQNISLEITELLIKSFRDNFNPPKDPGPLIYKPKEPEYNEDPE